MLQPSPVPAPSFVERLRRRVDRRALAIGLAVAIEVLMLLLLLSVGAVRLPGTEEERTPNVLTFESAEASQEAAEEAEAEPEQQAETPPAPDQPDTEQPRPPQPAEPAETPAAPGIMPVPPAPPLRTDIPGDALRPAPARPAPSAPRVYGPVDTGRPAYLRDTERVGTAPNGEPLYAAAWYREPRPEDLRAYLSTARGPGWGLIACRTAPDYRVEGCVPLEEYPAGSQINRAILAAAWEFRVRPPRRGGRSLVGAWVRIRIDYEIR
ncbi:hypothetical protein [Sphingosinicella terrae]|uniref:hypothetical protein n=1 Tax=Sphingosinicella terrae TaxID=2172047 RepID=UPI000E0D53C8|nr:hypothetical protein [Sphingosinicella terrae]